jgi:gamma-glutamyltranspeptidase/glutathione hydrolase
MLFLLFFIALQTLYSQDRLSGRSFATRSEVLATNGMAATSHPLATQIAVDILKKGGSAVDAAIAANAFLGFADPGMNGIGGDLFAIVWDPQAKKLFGLNGSGRSVEGLSREFLEDHVKNGGDYTQGVHSVTTPGCVDAWFSLHQRFGKLPMAGLLQPAITYAGAGVPITQETADNFAMEQAHLSSFVKESFKKVFMPNGRFPKKGELFTNPGLANSLKIISEQGRDGFYKGEIAVKIEAYMKKHGGFLRASDLAKHSSEWVDPISVNYRGYDVWEMPPNGQGMGVLQMLSILENFDLGAMGYGSAEHLHHFLEAKKLAYEDMAAYYGDPKFGEVPITGLLSETYARERSGLIDPGKAGIYHPGLHGGDHTVYLTVADKAGMMVSFIQSNAWVFGSGEVPDGLGFALQNRGAGFILKEGHINDYAPGKRPFHTIIPAFITRNGAPYISFGLMGGDMQTQGHVQVIMNLIDFGMNLQEAGDAPRVYHSGTISARGHLDVVGDTYMESGFDYETQSKLMDKGHNLRMRKGIFGGYQAIMYKDGVYYGASESRKDGQAAGY